MHCYLIDFRQVLKNNNADDWNNKLKDVFENDLYKEFIDAIKMNPEIKTILSFEKMNQFEYSGKYIKKWLEREHLKFVVENGENGNKRIDVLVEENYINKKQKSEQANKIETKVLNIVEIKLESNRNKHANKWILKFFFVPEGNKNKWIMFGINIFLFLAVLFAFVMPCFIPVLAFLHSIFVLTLEITCGLLSVIYGIILLKNIYFKNENSGKINITSDKDELNLKVIAKSNQDIALEITNEI